MQLSGRCWSMQITPTRSCFVMREIWKWKVQEQQERADTLARVVRPTLKQTVVILGMKNLKSPANAPLYSPLLKMQVGFIRELKRAPCQESAPLALLPHCSSLRRTRCIIYGFCHCLHMRQLPWNLLQKLSKMEGIVSFLVTRGVLNTADSAAQNLDSMADRCQLSSFAVSFREAPCWLRT